MATFTSKLEIHRAIIIVRRKIEFAEGALSDSRNIFRLHPADNFDPDDNEEEMEDVEFYKLSQEILALEAEHLAPLGAAAAALELNEDEEKEVQDLQKRTNSLASKLSLRLQKAQGMDPLDCAHLCVALGDMIVRAESENKRNKKTKADYEARSFVKGLIFFLYHVIVFLGALVVITS